MHTSKAMVFLFGILSVQGALSASAQELPFMPPVPDHAWTRREQGELRYLIPPTELVSLLSAAGTSLAAVQTARLFFYDSCDSALLRAGIYLSARTPESGDSTLWVRMRPFDSTQSDSRWVGTHGFSCSWQWVANRMAPSCVLERQVGVRVLNSAESGESSLGDLFSEDQRSFMTLYAPQLIAWENLVSAGPINSYRWEAQRDFLTGPLAIELWRLPTTMEEVLTVSTRARLEDLPQVKARTLFWLQQQGLHPVEDDSTRLRLAVQRQLSQEINCTMGRPWETYP